MSTYNSIVNTYFGDNTISPSSSFTGSYDSTTGYTTTKIVCSAAQAGLLKLNYADTSAGANNIEEIYAIYANHPSALTSLIKKPYAKVVLENPSTDTSMTSVNLKTKFSERTPHPYLSYITDDVTANVTVDISDLTFVSTSVTRIETSVHSGNLASGASSSVCDVSGYRTSVLSYEDTAATSSDSLVLYGTNDNGTNQYYIGDILPIYNATALRRYAVVNLDLTPFAGLLISNKSASTITGIVARLFGAS